MSVLEKLSEAPGQDDPAAMMKEAALWYVRQRQWSIFPCWWAVRGECGCPKGAACGNPGKHPIAALAPNGFKNATKDPDQVVSWWNQYPQANIAVATGRVSGVYVVDLDTKNGIDGPLNFADLAHEHGDVPDAPLVRTGSGGLQAFFGYPAVQDGTWVKCSQRALAPGVDVRADGGYAIVVPSTHLSGKRYEWVDEDIPEVLPEPPAWLYTKSREASSIEAPPVQSLDEVPDEIFEHIRAGLRDYADACDDTPWKREAILNLAGGKMPGRLPEGRPPEWPARNEVWKKVTYTLATVAPANVPTEALLDVFVLPAWEDEERQAGDDATPYEEKVKGALVRARPKANAKRAANDRLRDKFSRKGPTDRPSATHEEGASPRMPNLTAKKEEVAARADDWSSLAVNLTEADLSRPPKPREYLLHDKQTGHGVLPAGKVCVLAGKGGAGKTMALIQLAIAKALGREWFGWEAKRRGRVLLALGEEDREEVVRRLHSCASAIGLAKADLEAVARNVMALPLAGTSVPLANDLTNDETETPRADGVRQILRRGLAEGRPFDLVVVDPLSRFAAADTETSNAAGTRFIQILETFLAADCGAPTVIVAHHFRKAGKDENAETSELIRGAGSLVDGARWAAVLNRLEHGDGAPGLCRIRVVKSNYAPFPEPMMLAQVDCGGGALRLANEQELVAYEASRPASKPKGKATLPLDRISGLLKEKWAEAQPANGEPVPLSVNTVRSTLSIGPKTAKQCLEQLVSMGQAKRVLGSWPGYVHRPPPSAASAADSIASKWLDK